MNLGALGLGNRQSDRESFNCCWVLGLRSTCYGSGPYVGSRITLVGIFKTWHKISTGVRLPL